MSSCSAMARWVLSLKVRNPYRLPTSFFQCKYCTQPQFQSDLDKATVILVQNNGNKELLYSELQLSGIQWSSTLVEKVLKNIWNNGPQALRFFNWVGRQKGYKHSQEAYDYMIDILGRMRDYRMLWHLMSNRLREGCSITPKTFAIIMERYVAASKEEKATRVFLSMHDYGCTPDLNAFNSFLDILCKARKVQRAERLFREMGYRFRPDGISYNTLANGFCLVKSPYKAQKVLREMIERGLEPTPVTCNTLLHGFFNAGQVKEAWEFYSQMRRRGFSPNVVTYTTIVYGLGMAGKVEKARKVFKGMIKNGCLPNVVTYNAMIQVLCRKDSVTNAFVVFDEMLRKGYDPNLTTYNILIRGLCHAKQMDRALALMDDMKKKGCPPDVRTFNIIIWYYCDVGQIEKALSITKNMVAGECLPNLDTYHILLSALCATKKPNDLMEAGKLLQEMVERGFYPRRFVFNRVIDGLLVTGNQEFAKELLRTQSQSGRLPKEFRM